MNKNDISELAAKAKNGDKEAFEKLYREFYGKVYYFAKQNVGDADAAEDITAETFTLAMENISTLRSEESFVGWLYCIAYHKCSDHLKKLTLDRKQIEKAAEFAALSEPLMLPDDYAINAQTREQLQTVIDSLPNDMRSAVILYYYDGLSVGEVAEVIGTNPNNAKQKLFAARKKIKKQIEKLTEKGKLFSAVPLSAVLANLEGTGLLSGVAVGTAAAVGAAAVGVPVALSRLSGGTAKTLLGFTLKYWSRHKKSLAALLFSGVLLCALLCNALLTLRQEFIRKTDEMYDADGHYEFITPSDNKELIDMFTGEDTVTGKMNVLGMMGIGNLKYEYGTLDDPENLAHIPMESGRLPQKKGEIAIDRQILNNYGYFGKVGDSITLDKGTYTLVGIINDDWYFEHTFASYGRRPGSKLVEDQNKEGNYWIEDKSQFDVAYHIPLMFVSDEDNEKPVYSLVMMDRIKGFNQPKKVYVFDEDNDGDWGLDKYLEENGYDGEKFNQYSDYIRNHTQDAYSRFNGQFWDQIYKKVLIYGAAVIIAILSVITVMRNIFAERENTMSMLRRIGLSKRRARVMLTIEYIFLAILQTVIGFAFGSAVHMGIYAYQVNVLEKSDFSGFSHNEYDRLLCPEPFLWSGLIAAGVLLLGYVFAALMQRSRVPNLKRRKAGSVHRCFARIFRNRAVTVIQTVSLTLIIFGAVFGYMLLRPTIGSFDLNTGKFERTLDTKFGDSHSMINLFDFEEENVKEYYSGYRKITSSDDQNFTLPMLVDMGDDNGIDDETADKLGESFCRGVLPQTLIVSPDVELPKPVQWEAQEVREYNYKMSSDEGKKFLDKNKALYRCPTSLTDKATIEKLSDYVTDGEINIDKIMSGEEMIYFYSHITPKLKAGDEITVVSATTTNGFGIDDVREVKVRIGALVERSEAMDNMVRYASSAGDDFNLLTTVSGARKLGLHGAVYTEIIAREEIGDLLPMQTGLKVKSLKKQKHDIFVQNATLYGSLALLVFVMSLLGFAAYFNGIGMKIRSKEYQISIMRAIGTPLKKLRRRLMLDSVRIPVFAAAIAYGLISITQRVMLYVYDKSERIIADLTQKAMQFQQEHPGPETDDAYNAFYEGCDATGRQVQKMRSFFLTDDHMWFNNVLIPTLVVFAVICMVTVVLTRKSVGGFGSNIAYSISKGRKRR